MGKAKKEASAEYRLIYASIYRDKDWADLTHEFKAKNDEEATKYANQYIKTENKKGKGIERFELKGLEKLVRKATKEKTIPITIPV